MRKWTEIQEVLYAKECVIYSRVLMRKSGNEHIWTRFEKSDAAPMVVIAHRHLTLRHFRLFFNRISNLQFMA